jgi:hypothetical protein
VPLRDEPGVVGADGGGREQQRHRYQQACRDPQCAPSSDTASISTPGRLALGGLP